MPTSDLRERAAAILTRLEEIGSACDGEKYILVRIGIAEVERAQGLLARGEEWRVAYRAKDGIGTWWWFEAQEILDRWYPILEAAK